MKKDYIKDHAIESGEILGHEYFILNHPIEKPSLNGYVRYKKRPVVEGGYSGILTYIPVHGGITYVDENEGIVTYGFDTGHCDSHEFPTSSPAWIKEQIEIMIRGIEIARKVEKRYLLAKTQKTKAKYAQMVFDSSPGNNNSPNLMTMINILVRRI